VPWWRVIRSNGEIALRDDPARGPLQATLLKEEGVRFLGDRVDIGRFRWDPGVG
jgi:methylated-DNA-protein-cysteine methyltransferase-like protein